MTPPPAGPQVFSAAAGRAAVARSSYREGLRLLRSALKQEEALFFRYPELTAALGRAFQYASGTGEGIKLFETWFKALPPGENAPSLRFLLPFYGGRMARQRGDRDKALELFKLALEAAPDPLQKDASIWYILSLELQKVPQDFLTPLKTYMPRWHSFPYFDDILDRFIQYLTANRYWKTLEELHALFPVESSGTARAQCAYILGRAALTGKLSGLKGEALLRTVKADRGASLYYRVMASHWLGEGPAVLIPPAASSQSAEFPHPEEMELLLGFFQFGAGAYAYPYVAAWQETLSIPELRAVAEAYQQIEYWDESIRLVGDYQAREEYVLNRRDMELAYPQPFKGLIDAYAKDADLPAELLFGLIRTESTFRPKIRSPVGAVGLAQIMPATALDIAGRLSRRGGPGYIQGDRVDLEDPEINIHLGAQYLRYLITVLDQPMLAVLSYNGGITRIRRWWNAAKSQYPPDLFLETLELNETRLYGRRVLAAAAVYGYCYYDLPMEAVAAGIYR